MKDALLTVPFLSQSLRSYISKLVKRECDIDDVLQDTYIKMATSEQSIEYPQRYAKRVAKNIVLDMQRNQFSQHEGIEYEPVCEKSDLDSLMEQGQRIELYQGILADMPQTRREVFVRYRIKGQNKQTIASELGLKAENVDKHITRALNSLRVEMNKRLSQKGEG